MEANTPAKRQKPTTKKRQKSDPLATAGDGAFATVAVMNIQSHSLPTTSRPRPRRRPRPLLTLAAALATTCACAKPHHSPAPSPPSCALSDFTITRFALDGINGRDFLINNYVDLDPSSPEIADFRGRTGARARTYDGHQGIDIDIPSFREMDDGRAVIHAVTEGVVEQVIDDQPDRNVTCAGRWNVVRVRHANGFAVLYGHIQRGSARVRPGQPIAPGTPLAIVGSAGCSTQPHLHLEVRDCAGRAVETLREPGVWRNPPLDEPSSAVMDTMLVDGDVPSVAQVKDPARDPTVIEPDGTLGVGLSLAARGGDLITATLVAPDGASSAQYVLLDDHGARRYGHWYPRFALAIGASPGSWTIEIRINGTLAATRAVTVAPPREPPAVERRGPAVNSRARTSPPHRTARDRRRSGSPPPSRESRSPPGAPAPPAPASQRPPGNRTASRAWGRPPWSRR
jgi:hypothetical protein